MGATVRKTATNAKGSAKKSNKDELDSSFGLPEPVLAFIQDASMRLSMAPAKLKVAIAATRLEPRVFGIIEAIVQANQDETQEQRLKQSAEALREALVNIVSSRKDPFAEIDDGISRRELLIGQIMAELEGGRLHEQLFAESISVDEAADLIHRSRQALERRRREGKLLALKMKNQWRYPKWQFDPGSPGGVLPGLGEVLAELELSPTGAAAWLTEPSEALDNRTAIELLRDGRTEEVLALAEEVGHLA